MTHAKFHWWLRVVVLFDVGSCFMIQLMRISSQGDCNFSKVLSKLWRGNLELQENGLVSCAHPWRLKRQQIQPANTAATVIDRCLIKLINAQVHPGEWWVIRNKDSAMSWIFQMNKAFRGKFKEGMLNTQEGWMGELVICHIYTNQCVVDTHRRQSRWLSS